MEDLIELLSGEVVEAVIADHVIDVATLKLRKFGENSIECCSGFLLWTKTVHKVAEMNCEGKITLLIPSLHCSLNPNKSVTVVARNAQKRSPIVNVRVLDVCDHSE